MENQNFYLFKGPRHQGSFPGVKVAGTWSYSVTSMCVRDICTCTLPCAVITRRGTNLFYIYIIWWGKFSQKHNYKYMAKWWCLWAIEKLHVSACSGHLQVLTTFLLKEFYIICLNSVVMLRSHHHFTVFC